MATVTKPLSLVLLRVSLGGLMFWWGLNKIVNPGLSTAISDTFYFGLFSSALLQQGFGIAQTALGVLVMLGLWRRLTYPVLAVILGFGAVATWYAVIDPFEWLLPPQDTFGFTHLFYPSIINFAAALVVWGFRGDDRWAVDRAAAR